MRGSWLVSGRIVAPRTQSASRGISGTVDTAFAIFVVHEVPNPQKLFQEISSLLVPEGLFFYAEPLFVVSGSEFRANLTKAETTGLKVVEKRFFFLNRAAVLRKRIPVKRFLFYEWYTSHPDAANIFFACTLAIVVTMV